MHPVLRTIDTRRAALGYSQRKLATMLETQQSSISDILGEDKDGNPTLKTLDRLCQVLDLKLIAVDKNTEDPVTVKEPHPLTAKVVANQRRLAALLVEMSDVLADVAKVVEGD